MGVRAALRRTLASQLGKPRGPLGKVIAGRLNKANRGTITGAVDALAVQPGDDVADLGFGGGIGLRLLLDSAAGTVHGVDYSPTIVERARRQFRSDRLRLHTGSITELPLADDSVDGLITLNTIYFIDDLATAFAEMARILRPTGRAVIGLGDPAAMAALPFTEHGFRIRPVSEVTDTMVGAGLAVTQHRRVGDDERAYHLLVATRAG